MFPSKACGVDSHLLRSPAIHTQDFSFQHVDMSVFQSPFWSSFKRQKSFNVSSSCSTKQIYFNFSRSQSSVSRVSGSLESHLRSLLDELLNCKGKKYYFLDFWSRAIFKKFFKYKPVEKAEGTSKASGSSVRYLSLGMFSLQDHLQTSCILSLLKAANFFAKKCSY